MRGVGGVDEMEQEHHEVCDEGGVEFEEKVDNSLTYLLNASYAIFAFPSKYKVLRKSKRKESSGSHSELSCSKTQSNSYFYTVKVSLSVSQSMLSKLREVLETVYPKPCGIDSKLG
ncbi:hypothetical protein TNIN_272931 [Trichonephila inaurata madagascariensis]|uniref:Uncharacterized protein n=1 Tax=Trichonephila inaurata madagascariensis TaxID=2747483 RepID=A0A8X7CDD4_9ARAC|nr:hypothetical protein TNIN_272931 [Trichonephila inaurata madagascariensis]